MKPDRTSRTLRLAFSRSAGSLAAAFRAGTREALLSVAALALLASCSEKGGGGGNGAPAEPVADASAGEEADSGEVDPELGRRTNRKAPPLPALGDPIATVNGVPIRRVDFEDAVIRKFEGQTFALLTLVWREAYRDFGKKRGIDVTEKEIDAEIAEIVAAQKLPNVDGLLKIKCYDLPYLRKQVEFRIWVEKLAEHLGFAQAGVPVKSTDPRVLEAVQAESDVKMRADAIPDSVFAVVNGREVPQAEVLAWSALYAGPNEVAKVLDELISNEIDRQEVARAGIDVKDMDVNVAGAIVRKTLTEMVEGNRSTFKARGSDWDRSIRLKGLSVEGWIANQKRSEGVRQLVQRVADEEMIRRYFEENKDMLLLGEKYRVAVLTVDEMFLRKPGEEATEESKAAAKARIDEAHAALQAGMDWQQALEKFGTHKNMFEKGGELGWLNLYQKDNVPIRDAAVALEVGRTSAPFEFRHVWYIVKLLEKKPAAVAERVLKMTDQRARILDRLSTYGQDLWRDPIKARSDIRIFADLPLPYAKG